MVLDEELMQDKPLIKKLLLKILRTTLCIFALCICSLVLFISVGTYLFLSYEGKENTTSPSPSKVKSHSISEAIALPKKNKERQQISAEEEHASNERMKEGIKFMREFVSLREDSQFISAPPLCDILCAPSNFKEKALGKEIWDKFHAFMDSEGSRSFEDPKFRLVIEGVNVFADAMLVTGDVWEEILPIMERKNDLTESEKVYWSLRAPGLITEVVFKIREILPESRKQQEMVDELRKLIKQCDHKNTAEIEDTCQEIVVRRFN